MVDTIERNKLIKLSGIEMCSKIVDKNWKWDAGTVLYNYHLPKVRPRCRVGTLACNLQEILLGWLVPYASLSP